MKIKTLVHYLLLLTATVVPAHTQTFHRERLDSLLQYLYRQGGSIDGFNSILGFFPDDSVSVAYCSNGTGFSIHEILNGALSIYYNKPFTFPVFSTLTLSQGMSFLYTNDNR